MTFSNPFDNVEVTSIAGQVNINADSLVSFHNKPECELAQNLVQIIGPQIPNQNNHVFYYLHQNLIQN